MKTPTPRAGTGRAEPQAERGETFDERELKLPQWARRIIDNLRNNVERMRVRGNAAAITTDGSREWFTLPFAPREDGHPTRLYVLSNEGAHPVCSLSDGDTILIARKARSPR